MSLIMNVLWLFFGGLVLALEWIIAGVLCIIFIVTIPFARGCFEMASSCLMPFGKNVELKSNFGEPARPISAFLWIIFAGIWLAISHILIGIPFGIQNFKLVKVAFNPYKYTLI